METCATEAGAAAATNSTNPVQPDVVVAAVTSAAATSTADTPASSVVPKPSHAPSGADKWKSQNIGSSAKRLVLQKRVLSDVLFEYTAARELQILDELSSEKKKKNKTRIYEPNRILRELAEITLDPPSNCR